MGGDVLGFRYIFMDIENNGVPPDENGWNTVWNGPCGSTVKAEYIPANIDYATWQGFAAYVDQHSPYQAGVYSAGGDYYGSWTGIFGSEKLSNTAEWTYTNEEGQLTFPGGFSSQHASPQWFAGQPAACDLLWQWSGGDGVLNGYGDFDVADAAHNASPSCQAPRSRSHPHPHAISAGADRIPDAHRVADPDSGDVTVADPDSGGVGPPIIFAERAVVPAAPKWPRSGGSRAPTWPRGPGGRDRSAARRPGPRCMRPGPPRPPPRPR